MKPEALKALDALYGLCDRASPVAAAYVEMLGANAHAAAIRSVEFPNPPPRDDLAGDLLAFLSGTYEGPECSALLRAADKRAAQAFGRVLTTPAASIPEVALKLAVLAFRWPGYWPAIGDDIARLTGRDGAA